MSLGHQKGSGTRCEQFIKGSGVPRQNLQRKDCLLLCLV